MSISRIQKRKFWRHVERMVKGFGRAFALKKIAERVEPKEAGPIVARDMVRRYLTNQRKRTRLVPSTYGLGGGPARRARKLDPSLVAIAIDREAQRAQRP